MSGDDSLISMEEYCGNVSLRREHQIGVGGLISHALVSGKKYMEENCLSCATYLT